jgi:hypothetical protein
VCGNIQSLTTLIRHPPAFALQILDQPVDSPDNTPVQHLLLASSLYIRSYHRSKGPQLTRRIPLPAPSKRLLESAVLIDYQGRQPVLSRARQFVLPPKSKRRRRVVPIATSASNLFTREGSPASLRLLVEGLFSPGIATGQRRRFSDKRT